MRYLIIEATSTQAIVRETNALLAQGWRPLGGCQVAKDTNHALMFIQTMVMYVTAPTAKILPN